MWSQELFSFEKFGQSVLIGLGVGAVYSLLVLFVVKLTKTKIPKDENNDMLVDFMKKPYGPLLVGLMPGIFEELFFRGFLLSLGLQFFSIPVAIFLSTLVFWAMHVPQYKKNLVLNGNVILMSMIMGFLFVEFGSLWVVILTHAVYNYAVTWFVQKKLIHVYDELKEQ